MSPRRKRKPPPRCQDCNALITFLVSADTGRWRPFDPKPVNGRVYVGPIAYPTEGKRYWRLDELAAELQARHQYSTAEAYDEAYDVAWYVAHTCPTTPSDTTTDPEPSP